LKLLETPSSSVMFAWNSVPVPMDRTVDCLGSTSLSVEEPSTDRLIVEISGA